MSRAETISCTIITAAGVLAYVSTDDVAEALERLDGTLLVQRIGGVYDARYAGLPGDRDEDLPPYCAFTYDGRVLAN